MRIAILAGVSSDAQAKEDRLSIPDQVANCRAYIKSAGAAETAGPYIMDGYSRTGYDSLDAALQDIPPLAQAVKDATDNKYDILLMDNFDRLGDIGFILKTRFKKLSKQLHSVRQSGHLIPPELYDPYANESGDIAMYVEGIIQSYRINKIRRGYNIGVPNRARKGLHPLNIPFGYKLSAKNKPAEIVHHEAELIRSMAKMLLNGKTFMQIAEHANKSKIRPKRSNTWRITTIKRMLENPFYSGSTIYGKFKKGTAQPPSKWIAAQGRHEPIFTPEEFAELRAELNRRSRIHFKQNSRAFSGLFTCGKCGQTMHHHSRAKSHRQDRIACPTASCTNIMYKPIAEKAAEAIVEAIKQYSRENDIKADTASIESKIKNAEQRRQKIQQGFEAEIYTPTEASKLITTIEKEIETLTDQITLLQTQTQTRSQIIALAQSDLTQLKNWILTDHPATVNRLLTALCETIIIHPKTNKITIRFR